MPSDDSPDPTRSVARFATIKDVARESGVSTATVTRTVQGDDKVHPRTRARVLATIAELGYQPDLRARALVSGKSNTIGLLIPSLTKAYWGEVADSVERRASELGVSVVLGTSRTCFRPKESVLDLFVRSRVEGVIVAGFEGSPVQWAAARMGRVRLVLVEWDAWFDGSFSDEAKKLRDAADEPEEAFMSPSSEVSYLAYNELDAGRTVASHLLDLDHRAVTFVGPPTRTSLLFYCGALSAYELRGELVPYPCADGPDAGREAGTTILRGANPPTAIIAATDEIASGVMRAARELGVHVPGDLSVTGHDDIGVAEFLHPRLTTFRTPRDEIGRLAVESALGVRRAASPAQRLLGTLTVRESTGPTRRVR